MPDTHRQTCRILRAATLAVAAGLAVLVVLVPIGLPAGYRFDGATLGPQQWQALRAITALPVLCYLWALWAAQHALGEIAAGRAFQATVSRAMRQIGAGVLAGALCEVFVTIHLVRLVLGGTGSYAYVDLSAIVLGVVGAALIALAGLVDQARRLQTELDGIL
jgi:hypothetical protein